MSKFNLLIISAALVNIVLLFAIGLGFKQVETERLEQIRARAIIAECNAVSKVFYDAGVAVGGYSITKSPLFFDRYKKISEEVPRSLQMLKALIGENSNQQAHFRNVETTASDGMKVLAEAKAAIDDNRVDVAQFRARHMYKGLRQQTERLQEGLKTLTTVERNSVASANTPSSATTLVYSLLIFSTLLDAAVIVLVLLSTKRRQETV